MVQRTYECILVLESTVTEDEKKSLVQKIKDGIAVHKGEVEKVQEWGKRELAYPIKGKKDGLYLWLGIKGGPQIVKAAEESFKLNEKVLRHLITVYEKKPEVKIEKVKEVPAPVPAVAAGEEVARQ